MSFRKLQFLYRPPATVQEPAVAVSPTATTSISAAGAGAAIAGSKAYLLSGRLQSLANTARYLESLILAKVGNAGVTLDLQSDPELAQSLGRIYQTNTPPEGVTSSMYSHLLDTEFGIMRAEIAISKRKAASSTALTPNPVVSPIQKLDVSRVTRLFDKVVSEGGLFQPGLTSFLRVLKGDRVVFDYLRQSVLAYPVVANSSGNVPVTTTAKSSDGGNAIGTVSPVLEHAGSTTAATAPVDVDPDTAANLNERLDAWERVYAGIYAVTAETDAIYADVDAISQKYLYRPLAELEAALAMIGMLKVIVHKPKLSDLKCALTAFVLPRLIVEVSTVNMLADRFVQRAVSPVIAMLNSFGRLASEVQHVANDIAYLAGGGLSGSLSASIRGTQPSTLQPYKREEMDTLSTGTASAIAHISWAVQATQKKRDRLEASMCKAIDRKLNDSGGMVDFMKSIRSLEALASITASVRNAVASGSASSGYGQTSSLASFGQVVSQLKTGGNQVFTFENGTLGAVSSALPSPSPDVQRVLVSGGAAIENRSQLLDPTIGNSNA